MPSLGNAEAIGGVVVTIGSDLSGLKAGEREAKQIAASVEKIVAKVKLVADTSGITMQVRQLMLPPVRVPLLLDFGGAMGQLAVFRAAASHAIGGVGGGRLALPGMGGGGRGWDFEGEVVSSRMTPLLTGPASGYNGMGYEGGFGAAAPTRAPWWRSAASAFGGNPLHAIRKAALPLLAIGAIGDVIGGVGSAIGAYTAEGHEAKTAYANSARSSISGIPLIGSALEWIGDKAIGAITTPYNLARGRGWKSYSDITSDITASATEQDKRTDRMSVRAQARIASDDNFRQIARSTATIGMSGGQAGLFEAQQNLADFEKKFVGGGHVLGEQGKAAYAGLKRAVEIARGTAIGEDTGGVYAQRAESLASRIGIAGENTSRLNVSLGAQGELSGIRQQQLQTAKKFDAAELASFDSMQNEKISRIKNETEERKAAARTTEEAQAAERRGQDLINSAVERGAMARKALRDAQDTRRAESTTSLRGAGEVASLSAAGRTTDAQLRAFDIETERMVKADPANAFETIASRQNQKLALQTSIGDQRSINRIGLDTAVSQAQAAGRGENTLAGVLGTLGGFKQQLVGADTSIDPATGKSQRQEIAAAQVQIAGSMIAQLRQPGGWATEGQAFGEAPGGPDGMAGQDAADTLKALLDYIKVVWPTQ